MNTINYSHKRKKTLKKINCAPGTNKKYTCYTDESLIKLRNYWNIRHPDNKIETNNIKTIWLKLRDNMNNVCDRESCWLRQKFMFNNLDKELSQYTFAPKTPSSWKINKNEWLSSVDIEKVMKQYEYFYTNFEFVGPSPIDFDTKQLYGECVWEELCKFNLNYYLKNGKNKIGIIFNTDPHYKGGSHWISLFIDIKKQFIFYFDSNGNITPKEIKILTDRIKQQGELLKINFKIGENYPKEHQKTNTECGMYSLYFIISLIKEDHDPEYFKNHTIKDKEVEILRDEYYNKEL